MNRPAIFIGLTGLLMAGCDYQPGPGPTLDPDVARFVAEKESQARQLAGAQTNPIPAQTWQFFAAAAANNWPASTNRFRTLEALSGRSGAPPKQSALSLLVERAGNWIGQDWSPKPSGLLSEVWAPISETFGVCELMHEWDPKWLKRYAGDIIGAVPKGSIYFGGTDAGRFAVSAFSESHVKGKPFFTLTQNALADRTYLDYLRAMYGGTITVPTPMDSQAAFQQYLKEAQERLQAGQLRSGENIQVTGGRVSVSGRGAVMEINGLLVKSIIAKNPEREFYLEESYPMDWALSQSEPHGPILRLQAHPLAKLSDEALQRDREYWSRFVREVLGSDPGELAGTGALCDFVEQIHVRRDFSAFKGDESFLKQIPACEAFSRLRCTSARVYAWRADNATESDERERMTLEAERAFRQAFALWPERASRNSPAEMTAAVQFVQFLRNHRRAVEAEQVEAFSKRFPDARGVVLTGDRE